MTNRIDEIRERLAKATPGKWMWVGCALSIYPLEGPTECILDFDNHVDPEINLTPATHIQYWREFLGACGPHAESDAPFNANLIANAPSDVSYLLAELERTNAQLAELLKPQEGWVTLGTIHLDIETETETFVRAERKPPAGEEEGA